MPSKRARWPSESPRTRFTTSHSLAVTSLVWSRRSPSTCPSAEVADRRQPQGNQAVERARRAEGPHDGEWTFSPGVFGWNEQNQAGIEPHQSRGGDRECPEVG